MKNLLKAFFLIGCIALSSCDESLLDTSPDNKYVESNFWESEAAAMAALASCYQVMMQEGIYGGDATALWEETITPNEYNYGNAMGFNIIAQGLQSASSSGIISDRWADCYEGIGRCNTFLARVDDVEGLDEELKTRMKAEATFLRGLYYFLLETYYGGVPVILDAPNPDQIELPRNTREEVVAQVITDLDAAAAALPLSYGGSDLGRATQGAAMALKARVLFYEASPLFNTNNNGEKWKTAADAAKAVVDLAPDAGYGLFPDYRAMFLPENENNEEVIFDVQFIYPDGGNSFDLICRQYNTNAPLPNLADAYLMADGLPAAESPLFNPEMPYENRDPRLNATVVYPGDTYMGMEVEPSRFAITGFGLKKYSIYDTAAPPADLADLKGGQSETNYIVLRFGDVLLMYAEALNEYAGPGPEVYAALNQIRERVNMPVIEPDLSQAALREVIHHERRIELAGEGLYYNDIRRWKTAEVVLNQPIYTFDNKEIEVRNFDPSRDYWWPIPQIEKDLNPSLDQNTGY